MAKRGNRNKRNRRRIREQFRSQSLVRSIHDEAVQEEFKVKHKKYLEDRAEIEQDYLKRTIFVGNVKPLDNHNNLELLKTFLQQRYGRVEICDKKRVKRRDRYPKGRVRFYDAKDAEKIFGGMPLMEARKQNREVRIACSSVGHARRACTPEITIRPSPRYPGMVEDELRESKVININTENLSLGHWFPEDKDECLNIPGLEAIAERDKNLWVEEKPTTVSPTISFDFTKSVIELDMTHCRAEDTSFDLFYQLALLGSRDDPRRFASFRFKDLAGPIELCRCDQDHYYFIFSLNHPPRLCSTWTDERGWEHRSRHTSIAGLGEEAFGACLGYKLRISSTEVNRLLLNRNGTDKLHNFGVLRTGVESLQQAESFQIQNTTDRKRNLLQTTLARIGNTKVGLLLRSILDCQTCCWLHMLEDRAWSQGRSVDLCNLVRQGNQGSVSRVLTQMKDVHGKTRYPAQMFAALHGAAMEDEDAEPLVIPPFCVDLPRLLITPTRVCITGFQLEVSNRLVRKFLLPEHRFAPEAFVRVTIGDENGDKLFSDDMQEGSVAPRIRNLLLQGIMINGASYRFLAYSSSQLKELSVWMVACTQHGWSVEAMRDSMGDFSMCQTPSKYAARIGQCFSTTVESSASPEEPGDDG